ncbi:AMP-binding protein [Pseudomonas umsongensis]|uniref:AMP-binding protein n=1 Tax=Pseudomonas umsongensis TaxID=198618 RepID=UPI00384EF5BF
MEKIGFAGAPMSDGLMRRVEAAFQPQLFVNHFGSSEIYTFTIDQQASRKPGSSGRSAMNQRVRVVPLDAETADVQANPLEEGQIIADLASDEAFEGYLNPPKRPPRRCVTDGISPVTSATSIWRAICSLRVGSMT